MEGSGLAVRLAARNGTLATQTSGLAPTFLQANLMVLPSRYADDFRLLCARNPVACPLIAESASRGDYKAVKSYLPRLSSMKGMDLDIRRDIPAYNVYTDSQLSRSHCADILHEWTDDHIAFLIGCSYSFESALCAEGLTPAHIMQGRNVAIYRTTIPLCPAGVFVGGKIVVSMRSYPRSCVERVRDITRRYHATHGEPLAWGWDALDRIGIRDIDVPDWGDRPMARTGDGSRRLGEMVGSEEEVPVFWGCGVTPQEAVMKADLDGTVMAHAPGYMLLLDLKDENIVEGEVTSPASFADSARSVL